MRRVLARLLTALRPVVPRLVAQVAELPVPLSFVRWGLLLDDLRENRRDSWARLRGAGEQARYDEVRAITEAYAADGFVLDIGCSQGILQEGLIYRRYLGVDRSAEAIRRAGVKNDDRTRFVVGDGADYAPDEPPDSVVLNEMLYYLPDPVRSVQHYAGLLSEHGVVIVSVYAHAWATRRLLRQLHARLQLVRLLPVRSGELYWIIAVFRPRVLPPRR